MAQRACHMSRGIWGTWGLVHESLLGKVCEDPTCGRVRGGCHGSSSVHPDSGAKVCVSWDLLCSLWKGAGIEKDPTKNRLEVLGWGNRQGARV